LLTLEFKLRPGVKFHDGSDFTLTDVLFSVERVPKVPNSPASYANDVKDIVEAKAVDPLTVRFRSKNPNPVAPEPAGRIYIVSKKVAERPQHRTSTAEGSHWHRSLQVRSSGPGGSSGSCSETRIMGCEALLQRVTLKFISNDRPALPPCCQGALT